MMPKPSAFGAVCDKWNCIVKYQAWELFANNKFEGKLWIARIVSKLWINASRHKRSFTFPWETNLFGSLAACCCLSASRHYVFEKHPDALCCNFQLQCKYVQNTKKWQTNLCLSNAMHQQMKMCIEKWQIKIMCLKSIQMHWTVPFQLQCTNKSKYAHTKLKCGKSNLVGSQYIRNQYIVSIGWISLKSNYTLDTLRLNWANADRIICHSQHFLQEVKSRMLSVDSLVLYLHGVILLRWNCL